MQIIDILNQMGGIQSMARELGIDERQASAGAAALIPAILGGFKKQAQAQPGGPRGSRRPSRSARRRRLIRQRGFAPGDGRRARQRRPRPDLWLEGGQSHRRGRRLEALGPRSDAEEDAADRRHARRRLHGEAERLGPAGFRGRPRWTPGRSPRRRESGLGSGAGTGRARLDPRHERRRQPAGRRAEHGRQAHALRLAGSLVGQVGLLPR